eukprot:s6421_g3.t2
MLRPLCGPFTLFTIIGQPLALIRAGRPVTVNRQNHGAMSGAGSRNLQSLVLRYNYFLNTLDNSLANEGASLDTLKSHYNDLVSFVRNLSQEEKAEIQRENQDWSAERRKDLQERCRSKGVLPND